MLALLPGLCGPGRLPAARGRAVALRVEPPGYRRLAPDGRPSLTQHGQAGGAGWSTRRPFPVPGDRGLLRPSCRAWPTPAWRSGCARRSLRCAPLGARASRTPPRSPAMPGAGPLKTGCS